MAIFFLLAGREDSATLGQVSLDTGLSAGWSDTQRDPPPALQGPSLDAATGFIWGTLSPAP